MSRKLKLKGRTSPEKPGTLCRHFGVNFTVQKDGTLVTEQNDEIAEMLLKAERVDDVTSKQQSQVDEKEDVETEEDEDNEEGSDFQSMTRDELVAWAIDNYGVELDRKASKKELVESCEELEQSGD